ncbi:MAG: hypothetical protein AAF502_11915 [Bacteroidota bacterium]
MNRNILDIKAVIFFCILLLITISSCKNKSDNSGSEPIQPTGKHKLGNKSTLTESLNGTWEFSLKSLIKEGEQQVLGYLTLEDGVYQYTSVNKSPYRYPFILQSKGNYELQYLPGINESTTLSDMSQDTTVSNITFEIFTNPGDPVIKEFQIRYLKERKTLEFQTLFTGFQLWRLQKSI